MARHKVYYKGEGGDFPQVQVVVSFMSSCLPVIPSPYPKALACPSTPKVLQVKERTQTHFPSIVFTFGLVVESIKELGGASIKMY